MYNILIIGDIMIDHYIYASINKIANESPIPVFNYSSEKNILGGCGNVFQNMKLFNNNLFMLSVVGNDNNANIIKDIINNNNNVFLINDPSRKTSIKNRIIADNKILFRYDDESTFLIDESIENMIINKFDELCVNNTIDIVVFSDYNKGVLTEKLCRYIIDVCNQKKDFPIYSYGGLQKLLDEPFTPFPPESTGTTDSSSVDLSGLVKEEETKSIPSFQEQKYILIEND
jgi:D-beta-D-heptose 7-phosphate kinase/D-beta-D-heptose 1-phosphate adenosyltransferase